MHVNYAIVFVSDMQRSVEFYRDVMGLPLKFDSPHWSEFATEGATLALHLADGESTGDGGGAGARAAGEVASDASAAGRCRFGFSVPDLGAFHARMLEQGVPCLQEPEDVFGALLAQYSDPDGLIVGVGQDR
jgi:lactoylglutathione lyase